MHQMDRHLFKLVTENAELGTWNLLEEPTRGCFSQMELQPRSA